MGMIVIEMMGSFNRESFQTTATEGGHVAAIRRAITFLASQLTTAVVKDLNLAKKDVHPSLAPLGQDRPKGEAP